MTETIEFEEEETPDFKKTITIPVDGHYQVTIKGETKIIWLRKGEVMVTEQFPQPK